MPSLLLRDDFETDNDPAADEYREPPDVCRHPPNSCPSLPVYSGTARSLERQSLNAVNSNCTLLPESRRQSKSAFVVARMAQSSIGAASLVGEAMLKS